MDKRCIFEGVGVIGDCWVDVRGVMGGRKEGCEVKVENKLVTPGFMVKWKK